MDFPSEDQMRVEFRKIKGEVEALEGKVKPLRDEYDKVTQAYHKRVAPLIAQIKTAEAPLFELKNKMGTIVRALGGRTGG